MAKRSLESLTESMFYVLMALRKRDHCGAKIAEVVEAKTESRIRADAEKEADDEKIHSLLWLGDWGHGAMAFRASGKGA